MQSGVVVVVVRVVLVVGTHESHKTGQAALNFGNLHTASTCNGPISPHSSTGSGTPLQMRVVVVLVTVVVVVVVVAVVVVAVVVVVPVVVVAVIVVPVYDVVVSVFVVVVLTVVEDAVVLVAVTVVAVTVVVVAVVVVVEVTVTVVEELVQTPHKDGQFRRKLAPLMPVSWHKTEGIGVQDFGSMIPLHIGRVVVMHESQVTGHCARICSPKSMTPSPPAASGRTVVELHHKLIDG